MTLDPVPQRPAPVCICGSSDNPFCPTCHPERPMCRTEGCDHYVRQAGDVCYDCANGRGDAGDANLAAENERLRGVIALGEHREQHCDWCGAFRKPSAGDKDPHALDCPAFTPDGAVR